VPKWSQNGPNGAHDVPKSGILVFQKKVFAFLGVQYTKLVLMDVPKSGILVFQKKVFAFLGVQHAILTPMDVPKSGFLISRKKVFAFSGHGAKWRGACLFLDSQ